jgi:hypothetical protein
MFSIKIVKVLTVVGYKQKHERKHCEVPSQCSFS